MMNRNLKWMGMGTLAAAMMMGMSLGLAGCSGEEEQAVAEAPPPPPPPAPAPPPVATVEQLMAELNIDPRINLPEESAPPTTEERKAVLEFFDAVARGNAQAFRSMLRHTDQIELDALIKSGDWQKTVAKITAIDVQTGKNLMDQSCALAVIEVGAGAHTTYQPQLWYYANEGENMLFEAALTPPGIMDKLTGDWIVTWHHILADELMMAERPDVDVEIEDEPETSSGQGYAGSQSGGGMGGMRGAPGAPGGLPAPGKGPGEMPN